MTFKEKVVNKLKEFGVFVFNKNTYQIFGRTCKSWAQISTFFVLFYLVSASIFAAHLAVFLAITPSPSEGIKPWNYGRYAYPNYPNTQIALIAIPQRFTFKEEYQGIELDSADKQRIENLLKSANMSGVSDHCLDASNNYGYRTKEPCIFVHVAKVFNWTPDLINATLASEASLPIMCSLTSSDSNLMLNLIVQPDGLPLNLTNYENTNSYPFIGQPQYITPVTAVIVNLTDLPSNLPQKFEAEVTCTIDYTTIGMTKPSERILKRLYEIPRDSTTTIKFEFQ